MRLGAYLDQLITRLLSIATDDLRARTLASSLSTLSAAELVFVAGRLARRARDDHRDAAVLTAFSRALAREYFDLELVASARDLARSRADRIAEALFAQGPALRQYDLNEEAFVDRRMRAVPLGQRRALARSRDIDQLLRLAHDQDPRVIRGLLENPRLTERDAVLVAARRPTHVPVLEEVLRSRFGTSQRVRMAIAHNPYAPVALAARAMASLPLQALGELAEDDKLAEEVRRHARALIVARRPTPAERARAGGPSTEEPPADPELEALLQDLESDEVEPLDIELVRRA